jgi:glutamine synthetase adenylyltransferase
MDSDPSSLPDALREPVDHWLERYGEQPHVDALRRLVACSEFAGTLVLRDRSWFLDNVASFDQPPDAGGLESLVEAVDDVESVKRILRRYRNRFMLHVLWREVFGLASLDETLQSLLRSTSRHGARSASSNDVTAACAIEMGAKCRSSSSAWASSAGSSSISHPTST